MFRKLVSGLPFSPALVSSLGFYARRLKKEEATRRLGLIFTALALVVQSFAVFSPPEPANAASSNDIIYGGVETLEQVLAIYDNPTKDFKKILSYNGITRAELAAAKDTTLNSQEYGKGDNAWISWGRNSRFSPELGEVKHNIDGTIVYSRPLWRFDTTDWTSVHGSTYEAFRGTSKNLGVFAIMKDCGNLAATKLPTPPPPPPKPTAACSILNKIKVASDRYKFHVEAVVSGGATISSYKLVITNESNTFTKTVIQPSTNTSVDIAAITFKPGTYKAIATVETSVGSRTSTGCVQTFTVPQPPTPTHPAVSIDKKVDNQDEPKVVGLNTEYSYQIVVKNTGDTALSNVAVTDTPQSGITLLHASLGTITNNRWSYAAPNLAVGGTITVTLKAKVPSYLAGLLKNTACVETPTVEGSNPDDCDDVFVEVPAPQITVCELATYRVVTVKEASFNPTLHSKNLDDCKRIQVCNLATNIVVTIRETEFDATKHSKDLTKCDKIQVCDLTSSEVITIARNDFDQNKHSKDPLDCQASTELTKEATNLTQATSAGKVLSQAGDRIQFTLAAQNSGKVDAVVDFKENMTDTLEYATMNDNGGGALVEENGVKNLTWGKITLKPGEKVARTFTIKVLDEIPLTARGTSDPGSYDCIMTNTFGNTLEMPVNCAPQKAVESAVTQLPSTGPGENMLFAGVLGSVVTFFYARSRQLSKEVRLIRKDFNAGTL